MNSFQQIPLNTLVERVKVGFVGSCEEFYCNKNEGYPIIRTVDLVENGINFKNLKYITKEFYEKNIKSQLHYGDLLIARHGDNGKARIYEKDNPAQALNVVIIEPDRKKISSYLLKCFFEFSPIKLQIKNASSGSVQRVVNTKLIDGLQIPISDRINYNDIEIILKNLEKKIEVNNKINKKLESMVKTLYDYWFVQFDFPDENGKPYKSSGAKMVYNKELKREIPEGWEVKALNELIEIERGISYKSTEIDENGIPMINLNSFYLNGTYKSSGIKYFTGKYKESKVVNSGDLIIATTDVTRNADIIGKATIIPDIYDSDIVLSCDIAKVNFDKSICKYFLEKLFNSDYYHKYIKGFASGTLVLHLDTNGIGWYKTFIPPKELLNKFEAILEPIQSKKDLVIKENQKLSELRDWLLPMLMNGQVKVKDSCYPNNAVDSLIAAEIKSKYSN